TAARRDRVLEVEDEGVGTDPRCLRLLLLAVARDEQHRAQHARRRAHCGFLSIRPLRLQCATSSSRWLKARCAKTTMPFCGRDFDSRTSSTSVWKRKVSPWNTGFGKRTSSQ